MRTTEKHSHPHHRPCITDTPPTATSLHCIRKYLPRLTGIITCLALSACSQELALNLNVGNCVTLPADTRVASVTVTGCSDAHEAEVIALVSVKESALPSTEELNAHARTSCALEFENYVGTTPERSDLDMKWLIPSKASWKTGDRSITCLATAPNGEMLYTSVLDSHM